MFNDYASSLFKFLKNVQPEFLRNFEWIMAQWCFESGYFESKLAKEYFNPAGMKWRPELLDVATAKLSSYTDWENETEAYAQVDDITFSPYLYFRFVQRWPYKNYEDYAGNGSEFIKHLAYCGWCASLPNFDTSIFYNDTDKRNAIAIEYHKRVRKVFNSNKFIKLMTNFYRVYIDVASVRSITIDDLPFTSRG